MNEIDLEKDGNTQGKIMNGLSANSLTKL